MKSFYIPHKLQVGDITRLSDNDSVFAISRNIKLEDLVEITSTNGLFLAQVVDISKNSVEIEVIDIKKEIQIKKNYIRVIQSISHISKFSFFLEKITEIGADEIVPIVSEFTIPNEETIKKESRLWDKIINDACEQSRNFNKPKLLKPTKLSNLNFKPYSDSKYCFATENVNTKDISNVITTNNDITLAFGPESGWGVNDITIFKKNNFEFIKLKGNILRTETTPIVATTIIKFILKEL